MKIGKIVLATFLVWLISRVIIFLTCGWLFNWVYTLSPTIWLTPEQMGNVKMMVLSNVLALFTAFIFVFVYALLYKHLPNKGTKKGLMFGLGVWAVGALAGMIMMPFFMTISWVVVVYWTVQSLVINLINGSVVGAIFKK